MITLQDFLQSDFYKLVNCFHESKTSCNARKIVRKQIKLNTPKDFEKKKHFDKGICISKLKILINTRKAQKRYTSRAKIRRCYLRAKQLNSVLCKY